MKRCLAGLTTIVCLLAFSATAQAAGTWSFQSTTTTEFVGVFPIDANNVWAVGGEHEGSDGAGPNELTIVRHTTNGGTTWLNDSGSQSAETAANGHELKKVFFINSQEGWIIGERTDDAAGGGCDLSDPTTKEKQAIILHTTDGGQSWLRQASGTCSELEDIYMLSPTLGYITKVNADEQNEVLPDEFLKYDGTKWEPVAFKAPGGGSPGCDIGAKDPHATIADGISFPPKPGSSDRSEGWIVDGAFLQSDGSSTGPCILHTTDAGATWTRQDVSGCTKPSGSQTNGDFVQGNCGFTEYLSCVDTQHCWASSAGGSSTDGGPVFKWDGSTWSAHFVDSSGGSCLERDWDAVAFADTLHGLTGGEQQCPNSSPVPPVMFSTADGGLTWSRVSLPPGRGEIVNIRFADPCHAWAVGERGMILAFVDPTGCPAPAPPVVGCGSTVAKPTVSIASNQRRVTYRRRQFASVRVVASSPNGLRDDPSTRSRRISTSRLGRKTFSATATDVCGSSKTSVFEYRVIAAARKRAFSRHRARPRFTG